MLQVVHAIGAGAGRDGIELGDLGFAGGDDQLAAASMGNRAFGAVGVKLLAAGNAKPRLERSGRIVDAGVDHLAVARADAGAERRFGFEDQHLATQGGEPARRGEADDAGADHRAIDFSIGLCGRVAIHTMRGVTMIPVRVFLLVLTGWCWRR
jgi:hypothetical protein